MKTWKCLLIISMTLVLGACNTVLYSGLSEKEANEMLAILLEADISAQKSEVKDGRVSLLIAQDKMALAVELLKRNGYPRRQYADIADIFPEDGLISTPTAERARFMYALSQRISNTLSQIDGVLDARVHVVIPTESSRRKKDNEHSTASVFIKHLPELTLDSAIAQIKLLVSSSVEGLAYDNVNVVLFPAMVRAASKNSAVMTDAMSLKMTDESANRFWLMTATMVLLLLASIAANCHHWQQKRKAGAKVSLQATVDGKGE